MNEFLVAIGIGLFVCILGIINMTGNISSLHWYHRQRITEENRKPFGKLIGTGTLTIGISLVVFGTISFIAVKYMIFGTVLLIAGVVIGLAISVWAMIKYNKGIF